ncbi:dihydroxyacetone phosphate acyltransferase isoform X1 [Metopolophium dirhodum]|uniref:dihydroxyacetone phosphate acyltransferase isoform X1 n=1 Tax=Metopolophium dirhodum TaxID=44670 RepID=UPI0029904306|nr:dihydroxyacetone phosphate acyltransferase isoform X1 [Metopolophium dirhodum]
MGDLMDCLDYNLFVNILTSLKSKSDLKWTFKPLNTGQVANSQGKHLTNYEKKKILEQNIKLTILMVIPINSIGLDYATNKAMEILEDLQSIKKNTTIRMMGFVLIKILKSKLQGLYINEQKLIMMKSNFNKTPVIFVPSHRSYQDFILMAFICFNYNIDIPYVAAAMDFKNMKIMGNVLKQCGAFFLHRGTNAQDIIYRSVLYTYVKHLITYESSPLQFFIEGTRSRSNKSIHPKLGILKCIVNVLLKNEVEDIIFVPISINYDRLLEDKLFSYELLGIPKPKETTLGLINSIKNMDDQYGNIYINFASPFSLQKYIKDINANGRNNENNIISALAHEIVYRQQHNMILSYFNILSVALIYNLSKNMTEAIHLDEIINQISWISTLFKKCGAQIEVQDIDITSRIIDTIQLHKHFVTLKDNIIHFQKNYSKHNIYPIELSENINFKTELFDYAFPLILNQLYVNPSLHFIINIAFIIIISKCQIIWKNDILDLEGKFFLLRRLFEFEFVFFHGCQKEDFKHSVSIYLHTNEKEKELLRYLTINPYVICYRLIYSCLINAPQKIISEEFIYKSIHMKVEELHSHPYGLIKDVIQSALNGLHKMEIIKKYKKNDTILYEINRTIIMELVQIFDNIISNGNNLLKSNI